MIEKSRDVWRLIAAAAVIAAVAAVLPTWKWIQK
jgi:hypothetical protein